MRTRCLWVDGRVKSRAVLEEEEEKEEEGRAARARHKIELVRRGGESEWQWAGFLMHTAEAKV